MPQNPMLPNERLRAYTAVDWRHKLGRGLSGGKQVYLRMVSHVADLFKYILVERPLCLNLLPVLVCTQLHSSGLECDRLTEQFDGRYIMIGSSKGEHRENLILYLPSCLI